MATTKKKIELFLQIQNENDFYSILQKNCDKLICAEIYCSHFGSCAVLDRLFQTIKLEWAENNIVLLKVNSNDIQSLRRFWNHSEPFYMFIVRQKVSTVFRGIDQRRLGELAKLELDYFVNNRQRTFYEIDEITPEEQEYHRIIEQENLEKERAQEVKKKERQAARKRHRAEKLYPHLESLNFVLFWPHMKRAHPELYQRWDDNNIVMVGREDIQLTKELALDILYEGDAVINEASMHALLSAPALAICFRILDHGIHFISLVRKILYEDVISTEEKPNNKTAYEEYATFSLSAETIKRQRREEKERIKAEKEFNRARRLSELRRLAIQAREEAIKQRRQQKEQLRLEALKAGNVTQQDDDEEDDDDISIPEVILDDTPEESGSSEDEDEYFPPEGLLIPGFYSPPNDIAKANGLPLLFPKLVSDSFMPPPEFLPEHVLVLLNITKRHKAISLLQPFYKKYLIHLGIFTMTPNLDKIKHVSYSVKEYDAMDILNDNDMKLAIMVSIAVDLPLLQLVELIPDHVSSDSTRGEIECSRLFPVNYADRHEDFEDFQHDEDTMN